MCSCFDLGQSMPRESKALKKIGVYSLYGAQQLNAPLDLDPPHNN